MWVDFDESHCDSIMLAKVQHVRDHNTKVFVAPAMDKRGGFGLRLKKKRFSLMLCMFFVVFFQVVQIFDGIDGFVNM